MASRSKDRVHRSRKRDRSRSRSRDCSRNRRRHGHDDRVHRSRDDDALDWWHEMASQKADGTIPRHITYDHHSHSPHRMKSRAKMSNTEIVNDRIMNNAVYNRRMDAIQRRRAEDKLIAMGINPFLNGQNQDDSVCLMTEHLNRKKDLGMKRQTAHSLKDKKRTLSVFKKKGHKDREHDLDWSLHPEMGQFQERQTGDVQNESDQAMSQQNEKNELYRKWLRSPTATQKEDDQITADKESKTVKSRSLFESIFNESDCETE